MVTQLKFLDRSPWSTVWPGAERDPPFVGGPAADGPARGPPGPRREEPHILT